MQCWEKFCMEPHLGAEVPEAALIDPKVPEAALIDPNSTAEPR